MCLCLLSPSVPMRILLFLSALMIVALAIDASAHGGRYRKAVMFEANYQMQQFAYRASRYFESPIN